MAKLKKIFEKVLAGSKNIAFNDFILLVEGFGFHLSRVSGSHHIFVHPKVKELVNLQNVKGQVKPYQIKQLMELVERYNLEIEE
ncbi:MAG TPA: type II toxin-antitoxin system HicA family toxin [Anaerolineales bacterium]|nr:type II toxin-antitoxin system HicA family toxin [Anaerolineales bacterium]